MKNKTTAGILALFGGWLGLHRFYLGQPILGILYILLMFTGVGVLLGIIDALVFLGMDERRFDYKYNRKMDRPRPYSHDRRPSSAPRRNSSRPQSRTAQRTRSNTKKNPFIETGIHKYEAYDMKEAIVDFEKALEISPDNAKVHFHKACAHSLLEEGEQALYHLGQAIRNQPKYKEKMMTEDALAYVRIQDEFEDFRQNKQPKRQATTTTKTVNDTPNLEDDILLQQLNKLKELRGKGILTDEEFLQEKRKLTR